MDRIINVLTSNFDVLDFLFSHYGIESIKDEEFVFDHEYLKYNNEKVNWQKISESAPLTENEIDLYFEKLKDIPLYRLNGPTVKCGFAGNTNIKWNRSIIDKYHYCLDFNTLCNNPSIPWDEYLIDKYLLKKYNNVSNWIGLSSNKSIEWNEKLIIKYKPYLFLNCIIKYSKIFWNKQLVRTTMNLVPNEPDNKRLYLVYFSEITNIEWDLDLLLDFPISYSYWVRNIIKNRTINLNINDLREYKDKLSRDLFGILQVYEDIIWDMNLILEFKDLISFWILSKSKNVDWSINLIEEYCNQLDFEELSGNKEIKLKVEDLLKSSSNWNFIKLCSNSGVKWDINTVKKYLDKIDLNKVLEPVHNLS